ESTSRLLDRRLIEASTFHSIVQLWYFGQLIGNSDMHDGNLSFRSGHVSGAPGFRLAPAYDMLPMFYAPNARGIPETPLQMSTAAPVWSVLWDQALRAAQSFWTQAAADPRISAGFRSVCGFNADILDR